MAPRYWATPEQLIFLRSNITVFHTAQLDHKVPAFWVHIDREFFNQWPEVVDPKLNLTGDAALSRLGQQIARRRKVSSVIT